MNSIFTQIRPHRISEEIVKQIRSLIKDGKLLPGEKLPSERELADLLGIGRSSLREAVNILETMGFLEIKNRQGIFVRSVSSPIISNPLKQLLEEDRSKFLELYELRKDVELASTYKAAKLRTRADLARMKKVLNKMEVDSRSFQLALSDDLRFHIAIAQSTRNFLRGHILSNIFELSRDYLEFVAQKLLEDKKINIPAIYEQHKRIFEAIQERNQENARTMMEKHLSWVEGKWKEVQGMMAKERTNLVAFPKR